VPKRTDISSILIIGALLVGCSDTGRSDPDGETSQAELDRMSDDCGTPREWLRRLPDGAVHFQPASNGELEKIDCVMRLLNEHSGENLGFIGNETSPVEIESN
jgi:hypothetical protein